MQLENYHPLQLTACSSDTGLLRYQLLSVKDVSIFKHLPTACLYPDSNADCLCVTYESNPANLCP